MALFSLRFGGGQEGSPWHPLWVDEHAIFPSVAKGRKRGAQQALLSLRGIALSYPLGWRQRLFSSLSAQLRAPSRCSLSIRSYSLCLFLVFMVCASGKLCAAHPTAENEGKEKGLFSALRERVELVGFVKNETALRLRSPRQFSKVQNWLQVEVEGKLTRWAKLTAIARVLVDPVNHLETHIHDFNAAPVDRWEVGDTFEGELRELYLELQRGRFDARLGRQQIVWGEAIGLRILDVVNPQDFREFILDDFVDARIPLWGARLNYTLGDWTLEGLVLPDFEANRPADQGSEFQFRHLPTPALPIQPPFPPFPVVQVSPVKEPADGRLSDAKIGTRVTRVLRNMDLSLNYVYAWEDFPIPFRRVLRPNTFLIAPTHERLHLLGGSFNYAFDVFVIRGEGVLTLGRHFVSDNPDDADGIRQREFLAYMLGVDWTVSDNLAVNLQFFQTAIFNKPSDIPDETVNNALSLFLRADFWNETLFPQLLVLYGINFNDFLIRPLVRYDVTDLWSVAVGMDLFVGSRSGFFGQFAACVHPPDRHYTGCNDRVVFEVKRSFSL